MVSDQDADTDEEEGLGIGEVVERSFTPTKDVQIFKIRGISDLCRPERGGSYRYRVKGNIKYRRNGAVDYDRDFLTSTRVLQCPDFEERRAREVEGWRYLSRLDEVVTEVEPKQGDPSAKLRKTLRDPPYKPPSAARRAWEAHHIVPANDGRAETVQALAFRCRLHPNSPLNGIYLRGRGLRRDTQAWEDLHTDESAARRALADRTYHGSTFRDLYFTYLLDELGPFVAANRESCESSVGFDNVMLSLANDLIQGTVELGSPRR